MLLLRKRKIETSENILPNQTKSGNTIYFIINLYLYTILFVQVILF